MLSKYCFFKKLPNNQYVAFNSLMFEPVILNEVEYNYLENNDLLNFTEKEQCLLRDKGILVDSPSVDDEALFALKRHISYAINDGISLLYIIPSNICNLACRYCFIGQLNHKQEIISEEIIEKIVSEFYRHLVFHNRTTGSIIFYGGEPLTAFNKIVYTVECCKKHKEIKWDFAIVTNLTLLTNQIADYFAAEKFSVGVSIDGPKQTNDSNRIFKYGNGSVYDCVLEKIKILKARNINIGLSITLTNELLTNESEFLNWIADLDIKDINYNLMHFTTQVEGWDEYYKKASSFLFTSNAYLLPHGIVDDRLQRKIRAFSSKEFKYNDCGAIGGHQLCVSPNGDVTVCHGYWNSNLQRCGNIMTDSFEKIISSNVFIHWQNNLTVNKKECLKCPAIYICGGGCAMQSKDLFGDLDAVDEAFCIHTRYSQEKLLESLVK